MSNSDQNVALTDDLVVENKPETTNGTSNVLKSATTWQDVMGLTEKGSCVRHPTSSPIYIPTTGHLEHCQECCKAGGIDNNDKIPTLPESTDQFKLFMERIYQVQAWNQSRIVMLEQELADAQQTVTEQQQTVRALRRTIQQDLKVIKTMATEKQMLFEQQQAAAAASQEVTQTPTEITLDRMLPSPDDENNKTDGTTYFSPAKRQQPTPFPVRSDGSAQTTPSPANNNMRLQAQMQFFQRATMARSKQQQDAPTARGVIPRLSSHGLENVIPEEGPEDHDDDDDDDDIVVAPPTHHVRSTSQSSSYWNDADMKNLGDPSKIFASFRGGLLDIPKSPPLPSHEKKQVNKPALQLDGRQKTALQLPVRHLSRQNSTDGVVLPVAAPRAEPQRRQLNRQNSTDGGIVLHGRPSEPPARRAGKKKPNKEISLDLLAEKLTALPLSRQLGDQSPEQFFSEKVEADQNLPAPPLEEQQQPVTEKPKNVPEKPVSTVLLQEESAQSMVTDITSSFSDDATTKPLVDSQEASKASTDAANNTTTASNKSPQDKLLFSVTAAESQDRYGDVGSYTGTILVTEGLPHGTGTMNYESGRVYSGQWVSGQWNGKGKLLNPNGDTYEGEFVFDARHGKGVYRWDNGDVYTGQFREDKRHGKGKFCFHNGNVYSGEFCDGMFEGFGRYEFAGGYYEGEWKEGRYHGNGELLYATGGKYTGEFRNSVAHGFGMEVTPDGRKRRGVWENGQPAE